ncbi:MAG: hypothetical protein KIS86_01010 [Devosia sp.]|nr:hypothetical protein [Devosia sp.]
MLTERQIEELVAHARACRVAAVEISGDDWLLRLEPGRVHAAPARPAPPEPVTLFANGMGRFHPAWPEARPGEFVPQGQAIGFLRTGAILRPLRALAGGTLSALLVGTDELVGYGQPVATILPGGEPHAR